MSDLGPESAPDADSGTDPTQEPDPTAEAVSGPEDGSRRDPRENPDYLQQLRREAAKYRNRAKTAESQRDTLQQRVDVYDRDQVARIAAEKLADPRDLLDRLADLSTVRGETGEIDEQLVGQQIDQLLEDRPHLAKPTSGRTHRDWGAQSGGGQSPRTSLGEAFKNALHPQS